MDTLINKGGNFGGINIKYTYMEGIKVGDIVYHQLSKLLFKCENKKMMRWMNMNPFYIKTDLKEIDYEKFEHQQGSIIDTSNAESSCK